MLGIAIDVVILVALLKLLSDAEVGLLGLVLTALVTAIGTALLAIGLVVAMGALGALVAVVIAAAGLGFALSALYGIDIRRALLIAGLFMVIHIGVAIGFQMLLRA